MAGWDSLTDIEKKSEIISVFPNPSNRKFTIIESNSNINAFDIYNAKGTKVFSTSDVKELTKKEIDISGYGKGIYFVKIDCGNKICTEKIVIQ